MKKNLVLHICLHNFHFYNKNTGYSKNVSILWTFIFERNLDSNTLNSLLYMSIRKTEFQYNDWKEPYR